MCKICDCDNLSNNPGDHGMAAWPTQNKYPCFAIYPETLSRANNRAWTANKTRPRAEKTDAVATPHLSSSESPECFPDNIVKPKSKSQVPNPSTKSEIQSPKSKVQRKGTGASVKTIILQANTHHKPITFLT